jgi:hypothetical protein
VVSTILLPRSRAVGLGRDALYLVRPDGHVALADARQDVRKLEGVLDRFSLIPAVVLQHNC